MGEPSEERTEDAGNRARVVEVGLRDGLQSLSFVVPTERKLKLIGDLVAAGVREFDVASFVRPDLVPALADSEALIAALPRDEGVSYGGLVMNMKGLERALGAGLDRLFVLTQASETFSRRNANCTVDESLDRVAAITREVGADGPAIRGYVSCVVACPYEGPVEPSRVADLVARLLDLGCDEVSLGETIGVATPPAIARLLDEVLGRIDHPRLGVHFHDTFGQAIANLAQCLERGVTTIDSSFAGIGGCPFAPGASGNVATEDVLYLLEGYGVESGIDAARVAVIGGEFCAEFDLARASKAGLGLVASVDRAREG